MKYVVSYLVLYAATLGLLAYYEHFDVAEPLMILAIVGGGFTLIAWLLTRRAEPLQIAEPKRGVIWYLLVVAIFSTWGLGGIGLGQPWHDIAVIAAKLTVFVAVPWLLFDRTRPPLRMNGRDGVITVAIVALLLVFQSVVGRGARDIAAARFSTAQLVISLAFAFVWLSLEAGVVEEYFFRRLLQGRLETLTKSKVGAIVVASLLFGLVHAPGLYLRTAKTGESALGSSPSLLFAVGYAIVVISPMAFFLGTIWSRTRNILIVVIIHGAGDLLPGVVKLSEHFSLR